MKKIPFALALLLSNFLFIPFETSAQSACSSVVTAAVNYRGTCQYFSNPCQVPSEMKIVPSCDLIEEESGLSLEEKSEQRRMNFFRARPLENDQIAEKTYNQRRRSFGSGSLTRGNVNRSGSLRARNNRQFTSRIGRSSLNTKSAGPNSSSIIRTGTFRRLARATGPSRTGAFENKPKWSAQQRRHSNDIPLNYEEKPWESTIQLKIKERLERKRAQREAYQQSLKETDGLSELRRGGYRESTIGNLNNYTEREE